MIVTDVIFVATVGGPSVADVVLVAVIPFDVISEFNWARPLVTVPKTE